MQLDARLSAPASAKREGNLRKQIVKNKWAYVFISPFYILWIIFGLIPLVFSMVLSFADWRGIGPFKWVGWDNFEHLLGAGGEAFWQSLLNGTILFFMYVPIMTFLAVVLAVILNSEKIRGFRIFRTMFFAPYVTSMIAAGFTFKLMLEQDGGLFNVVLEQFGLEPVNWLGEVWLARASLCLLIMWGWLGYNMVLMLAGLQTIPKELNEAALIDGATPVQVFFNITIPLLRPVIIFSVILSTMGSFYLFNEVSALTGGGPQRSTITTVLHIYNTAFSGFRYGRAAAQSYVYAAIILVLTLLQWKFTSQRD